MGAGSNNRDKVVNAIKKNKIKNTNNYKQHYNNNNRHLCIYVNVFLCVYVLFLSAVSLFSPSLFLFLSFSVLAVSLCVYLLSVYDIFSIYNYYSLSKFMASNL